MSTAASPLQQVEDIKQLRVIRELTFPDSLRKADSALPATISMKQLSADEELMASKLGRGEYIRSQYAAIKLSIVALGGKPVNYSSTELEVFWERCSPKVRTLLMDWYVKETTPLREETDAFFKSQVVKV
jgi:hypothetical protein